MADLSEYELKILRLLNGEDVPGLAWGAAMSVAIETLYEMRLAKRNGGRYEITDAGRDALKAREA